MSKKNTIQSQDVTVADSDLDGVADATENLPGQARQYAEQLATQLRKGFLAYCVLEVCSHQPKYTSDIIAGGSGKGDPNEDPHPEGGK